MVRAIVVMVCMAGWCVWLHAPEMVAPDPDAPPVWMPASVDCRRLPSPLYQQPLYHLAGQKRLSAAERSQITADELASLRYLILAGRRDGRQHPLPLAARSRPLLHVLNELVQHAERHRLPEVDTLNLYAHYGVDAATALALVTGRARVEPILADVMRRDGVSARSMTAVELCGERGPSCVFERMVRQPWSPDLWEPHRESQNYWFVDTLEWALLDASAHVETTRPPPRKVCFCQTWEPLRVEAAPDWLSIRVR